MKKDSLFTGVVVGAITSLTVIALTLAGAWLLNLPPIPLDIFDWMARSLPGPLIAFGIDSMVTVIRFLHLGPTAATAKLAEQLMGLLTMVGVGVVFGGYVAFMRRYKPDRLANYSLVGGLVIALVTLSIEYSLGFRSGALITILWVTLVFISWGMALSQILAGSIPMGAPSNTQAEETSPLGSRAAINEPADHQTSTVPAVPAMGRREFIYLGATAAAAVIVSAAGLQRLRSGSSSALPLAGNTGTVGQAPSSNPVPINPGPTAAAVPTYPVPAARIKLAPGTRPEMTPAADFYRIDIDVFPPTIDAANWTLELDGLVDNPLSLRLDDIRSRASVSQPLTMQCISNPVGGDLTGTTIWTGVPFKDILAEASPKSNVVGFNIQAKDGFYEFIFLKDALDPRTLLVFEMDGEPLTYQHGFPVRIYIPNRYGMKQPKWITHIEAMDHEEVGYWVERGWDHDAIVQTTSVIDTVAVDSIDPATRLVPVGGIAWAGERGISKVEVQVDSGPWAEAQLNNPPISALTWIQWRYDWPAQAGKHTFSVRAYDGAGKLQEVEPNPPEPSGATGIFSVDADVKG